MIYCAGSDTFLFGKRSAAVKKSGLWNFFGGRVDRGEQPLAAMVRELAEEAGLQTEADALFELDCFPLEKKPAAAGNAASQRVMHYYLLLLSSEFVPLLNHEHADSGWFCACGLPARFNRPTSLAIERGILEKARRMAAHIQEAALFT